MADFVWLRNPETQGVWNCPIDYAPTARARGWVDADAPEDVQVISDDVEPVAPQFDPAEHTVAEVREYLDEHEESAPGEVERVLDAERNGKNRSGITGD